MGLRLKFNLVLIGVFAIGLAACAALSHRLLHDNARAEVERNAAMFARPVPAALWRDLKAERLLDPDVPTPP